MSGGPKSVHDLDLPDLVVGAVQDARELVETQVSALREDVGERLGDLGTAIKSWLIVVCVAIVTAMLLGLALAATLTDVCGLPWFVSMWIVTATAIGTVALLVARARAKGRKASRADEANTDSDTETKEQTPSWPTTTNTITPTTTISTPIATSPSAPAASKSYAAT